VQLPHAGGIEHPTLPVRVSSRRLMATDPRASVWRTRRRISVSISGASWAS
jgi:hypothetical protein